MKILLTGASGFIGRTLLRRLQQEGHEVLALCHAHQENGMSLVSCDLSKPLTLAGTFDIIIHAAGISPAQTTSMKVFKHANVDSMENLLAWASAGHAKRMIFLSSVSVYGEIQSARINEDTPIIQPNDYGLSKYVAEQLLLESSKIEGLALRLPGVFGIQAEHPWLARVVQKCINGEDVTIYAPEFVGNNYLYVEDLAMFILQLLDTKWTEKMLLLGLTKGIAIQQAVEAVRHKIDSVSRIVVKESKTKPFALDVSRAVRHGFASHSFMSMIDGCLCGGGGSNHDDFVYATAIDKVAS